jgi:hypothetical protein
MLAGSHWSIQVGPWPWSLLSLLGVAVVVTGILVAVQSAKNVVAENRNRTIAWRVIVCVLFIPASINGVFLPVGAAYIALRYGPAVVRRRKRRSAV